LHDTNGKYENLKSIKSQLYYHHAIYNSCSHVVNFIREYFMETDFHLQISQHQARLIHENFTLSYHSYTPHYYRKTFCSYSYILVVHFTASTI